MATVETATRELGRGVGRRTARLAAIALAVIGAVLVWAAGEGIFDLDLRHPAFDGGAPAELTAARVAATAAVGAFAGWALLALLERFTARARTIWLAVAALALLMSLGGPLSAEGVGDGNRAVLVAMHLVVGGVVIPILFRTSPRRASA